MKVKIGKYPKHRWYHNWLFEKFGILNNARVSVHIEDFDTWSMDHTLAYIIEPMLKQLKLSNWGASYVSPEDVPGELRPTKEEATALEVDFETDSKYFDRWDWVLDEMIFAFGSYQTSHEWDNLSFDEYKKREERVSNGLILFGKYYGSLWD